MYLGWDIGIKNLAYCNIVPITKNIDDKNFTQEEKDNLIYIGENVFHIKDWDVINLVDKVESNMLEDGMITLCNRPKLTCYYVKNTKGAKCGKKATFCLENKQNGEYQGLCANHFKRLGYTRLPLVDNKPKCYFMTEKNNIQEPCKKNVVYMLESNYYIGYCKEHHKEIIKNKIKTENDFLKVGKAKKAQHINLTNIGLALYQQLDTKPELLDVNIVLLENQPVLTNPTMKSVQMLLYSYFIIKGIKEPKENKKNVINDIKCYSASKKTSLVKYMSDEVQTYINGKICNLKGKYAKNKKTAILLVTELVKGKSKWDTYFNTHKKKDDLADAFLMTLHYLMK